MTAIFKKLNLKEQKEILVVNAPESFEPELAALENVSVLRNPGRGAAGGVHAGVRHEAGGNRAGGGRHWRRRRPATPWCGSLTPRGRRRSTNASSTATRAGKRLGRAGFEPVRQVAIDEDWSALRFRRAEFIKTLTRDASWAMSEEGKKKAGKK